MLFFFLPARSPVPVGWEAALKQGAALPVRNSISHYREDGGWQGMVTQAGKVPLASASAGQHCKLFCMKSSHLRSPLLPEAPRSPAAVRGHRFNADLGERGMPALKVGW